MNELITHPLGETVTKAVIPTSEPVVVETFGDRIHVEWNPGARTDGHPVGTNALFY